MKLPSPYTRCAAFLRDILNLFLVPSNYVFSFRPASAVWTSCMHLPVARARLYGVVMVVRCPGFSSGRWRASGLRGLMTNRPSISCPLIPSEDIRVLS